MSLPKLFRKQAQLRNWCYVLHLSSFENHSGSLHIEADFTYLLAQQIILRELEFIMNRYPSGNTALFIGQEISSHLDILIALAHFTVYIIASHDGLRSSFSRQSHFNSSLVNYIMREVQDSLLQSGQPELLWKHAISVGVITELIVQTRRNLSSQGGGVHGLVKQGQEQVILNIVNRLLRGDLEVQYILGMYCVRELPVSRAAGLHCYMAAPLCGLLDSLPKATSFSTKHITCFKVMQELRALLLENVRIYHARRH